MIPLEKVAAAIGARESKTARSFKQPPKRGAPYYDMDRGHWRFLSRSGGRSINLEEAAEQAIAQGKGDKANAGAADRMLRRAGVLADKAAGHAASGAETAGGAFLREQPYDVGTFVSALVVAAAGLMGLVFLDMLLSAQGSIAVTRTLSAFGAGVQALVDPNDPLLAKAAKPPAASSSSTASPTVQKKTSSSSGQSLSAAGRYFPVASASASFTDTYGEPRADTGSHYGTDIFADRGTPVVAVEAGTLSKVAFQSIGGNRLWLNGHYYYAHLDRYAKGIKEGVYVKAGQVLGYVGTTGDAKDTPPHLHFAWQPEGTWANPYSWLRKLWNTAKSATKPRPGIWV
jgi:murein DD-endopeptidase MepM/ murein hydrolase activator NlpD